MNYQKEVFQTVLDACLLKLAAQGRGERNRMLKYAMNLEELRSCLREYLFLDDTRESRDEQVRKFLETL